MLWKKKRVYLDAAAGMCGNASSPHEEGRKAKQMLEEARTAIARLIEVQPDDVIFTSGATEANALAILGVAHARALATRAPVHMLYLPSAHASVVLNAKILAAYGATAEPLPLRDYQVDTEALAKMLRPETVLVTMEAVCGETGVIWNTREVANVLKTHNEESLFSLARGTAATREKTPFPIVLHIDASQAPLTEKISRAHFDADMMVLDGAKVGVRGIGALIAHRTIPLEPLYRGGGQERGLRPGSEAPELASAFAAALRAAALGHESFCAGAEKERTRLVAEITATIPDVLINEGRGACLPAGRQAPNILNLSFPGRDTDYLVALLDEEGYAVSTRSACETDSAEGSRAVFALTGDRERARTTLRISWGPLIKTRELARFAQALSRAVGFIDNHSHG